MYEIRLCKANELDLLKNFLRQSWSQNHIFLDDNNFLDFQHKSLIGYNFVVAYHVVKKEFHGILGIVSKSHYSKLRIVKDDDIWLAIWKVDKDLSDSHSLGSDLLKYVERVYRPNSISAIGINESVSSLYKLFGYSIKTMNQWFIPNYHYKNNHLIVGKIPIKKERLRDYKEPAKIPITKEIGFNLNSFSNFLIKNKTKKDQAYILSRYNNHPSYSYKCLGFFDIDQRILGFAVGRVVTGGTSKAMRLTELFFESEDFFNLSESFQMYLVKNNLEYIDFLEYGFDDISLESIGFIKSSDSLFVPHHFEPFEAERKKVMIAFKSKTPFNCTKGDSDLDRPNSQTKI